MPVRLLRDWTDSTAVDQIDLGAEVLFLRIIMKADDHGRFHGNPRLLKSLCFPLRSTVRESDITLWLDALQTAGLIRLYVAENKPVVVVSKFGQKTRSKSKFPDPPSESANNCQQPLTSAHLGVVVCEGVCVPHAQGEQVIAAEIPTAEEVVRFGKGCTPEIPEVFARDYHAKRSEKHEWIHKGRLIDWHAQIRRYWSQDKHHERWSKPLGPNGKPDPIAGLKLV